MFKFERLRVYQLALDYVDLVYDVADKLPRSEQQNLCDQIKHLHVVFRRCESQS